jgi:hypothetical protein
MAFAVLVVITAPGCQGWNKLYDPPAAAPLGSLSDPVWQNQEINAEMANFIIHQHEFRKDSEVLNTGGEDHVKQIAHRLHNGHDAKVVVERSFMSPRGNTQYKYPVHPDPKLDMRRREIIVRSLAAMGITDADSRVVVAPSFAQGLRAAEAEQAFRNGMQNSGGFGGGFGGGSGGGSGGGFGGGFF